MRACTSADARVAGRAAAGVRRRGGAAGADRRAGARLRHVGARRRRASARRATTGVPSRDDACTPCHAGFKSVPGKHCWSCHAPGEDTSSLSSPSAACSQDCHLYDKAAQALRDAVHARRVAAPRRLRLRQHLPRLSLDEHRHHRPRRQPASQRPDDAPAPTCRDCHDGVIASAQVTHDGVACTAATPA